VEKERFNETVFQCSKICQKVWSQKRILEEVDPMAKAKEQVIASCSLLIAGIVCFFLSSYGDYTSSMRDNLGLAGCVLVSV
jgi:hypothetical protein